MRFLVPLIAASLLAGCAGRTEDYLGPRGPIMVPQLTRYGFDVAHVRCVNEQLTSRLSMRQLRRFAAASGALMQGYSDPDQLRASDLVVVANALDDPGIGAALAEANSSCGVDTSPAPPPPVVVAAAPPAPPPPAWLNLGAADSGQSIAVDASTIERGTASRSAWFRLTDPGATASSDIFHLVVDCDGRTINATERRRLDPAGNVVESRPYPDNPLPVEDGTVMQIAWMSLCT